MGFVHVYMGIEGGGEAAVVEVAVYFDLLETVVTAIQDLNLTGIDDANVQLIKANPERETVLPGIPGILVMPIGEEAIPLDGGSLRRDDIGYPVGIMMFDVDRQSSVTGIPATADEGTVDQDYNFNNKLLWREKIRKRFIRQRITGVDTVYICEVEPNVIVDAPTLWEANIWMGSLVLRFISREVRTTS